MILTVIEHVEAAEAEVVHQDQLAAHAGEIGAALPSMTTAERVGAHLSIAATLTAIESQAALREAAENY